MFTPSPSASPGTQILLLLFGLSFFIIHIHKRWIKRRSLPPGPTGLPLIGNLVDLPQENGCYKYASMAKKYGDIMYLEALGQPIVVLNRFCDANELFEKRSSNYSDRPYSRMFSDIMGWKWNTGFLPYGDRWRRRRRVLHNFFNQRACQDFHPIQLQATQEMMKSLLNTPKDYALHVRSHAVTIILKITYGYDTKAGTDAFVELANATLNASNEGTKGGIYAVDIFPFLQRLPLWLPGMASIRYGRYTYDLTSRMLNEPFDHVKTLMLDNLAESCFVSEYMKDIKAHGDLPSDQEVVIKDAAAVAYAAGADTTTSSLHTFILAMTLHPEIQKKAQEELDIVVGNDRLPDFEDQKDLPYVQCLISETLRWQPVTPLGIAHQSVEEDFYKGYRIPAGTVITPNIWAMLHDPVIYPHPEVFNPDRFRKEEGKEPPLNPVTMAFGFGRRICIGRYVAVGNIFISIASILSVFNIEKALDNNGDEIVPEVAYTPGLVSYPKPFQCNFVPRSARAIEIIKSSGAS